MRPPLESAGDSALASRHKLRKEPMPAPLDGLLILDLTHVLAGPFASTQLQDFGACVIKVERPGTGDDTRAFPPFRDGESAYFAALNHGKQSITLDLKAEPDRALFDRLLAAPT